MAKDCSDGIMFSNGIAMYANHGIVGIDADGAISEGYDGGISEDELTHEQKVELADLMISRWTIFRGKHVRRKST